MTATGVVQAPAKETMITADATTMIKGAEEEGARVGIRYVGDFLQHNHIPAVGSIAEGMKGGILVHREPRLTSMEKSQTLPWTNNAAGSVCTSL